MPVVKTKGGNQEVDGLADCTSLLAEPAAVPGGQDSHFFTSGLKKLELPKLLQDSREGPLVWDALENFAQNQVRGSEALPTELAIKVVGLTILSATQVVDPDRGINDDHLWLFVQGATCAGPPPIGSCLEAGEYWSEPESE